MINMIMKKALVQGKNDMEKVRYEQRRDHSLDWLKRNLQTSRSEDGGTIMQLLIQNNTIRSMDKRQTIVVSCGS
jgi:ribosomal protein L28